MNTHSDQSGRFSCMGLNDCTVHAQNDQRKYDKSFETLPVQLFLFVFSSFYFEFCNIILKNGHVHCPVSQFLSTIPGAFKSVIFLGKRETMIYMISYFPINVSVHVNCQSVIFWSKWW